MGLSSVTPSSEAQVACCQPVTALLETGCRLASEPSRTPTRRRNRRQCLSRRDRAPKPDRRCRRRRRERGRARRQRAPTPTQHVSSSLAGVLHVRTFVGDEGRASISKVKPASNIQPCDQIVVRRTVRDPLLIGTTASDQVRDNTRRLRTPSALSRADRRAGYGRVPRSAS